MKYNKESEILVLDLINRDNGTDVTLNDIDLYGVKLNNDGDILRDTRIECRAIVGSPYYGRQFFTYQRVNIGEYFENWGTIYIPPEDQKKISDVLPALNEKFDLALTAADIIDDDLGDFQPPYAVKLIMREANFAWRGEVELLIADPAWEIGNVLVNNALNGLVETGVTEQFDLTMYSKGYDFSKAASYLKGVTIGTANDEELADILNGHVDQIWDIYDTKQRWNWKDATVMYNGVVNKTYTTRTDISNVLVVAISEDYFPNPKGYILFHYND